MQRTLHNLPDAEKFNGSLVATAIGGLLRPILVMEGISKPDSPPINLAIDYYAPAAAARLGLPVERTLYVLKEDGVHDDRYTIVDLPKLIVDPWGRTHAGGGKLVWRDLPKPIYESIMGYLGKNKSNMIGKSWVFVMPNRTLKRFSIGGYDGNNYYDGDGHKIIGKISRH